QPERYRHHHAKTAGSAGATADAQHAVKPKSDHYSRGQSRAGHVTERAERKGNAEIERTKTVEALQNERRAGNPGEQTGVARRCDTEIGEICRVTRDHAIGAKHRW